MAAKRKNKKSSSKKGGQQKKQGATVVETKKSEVEVEESVAAVDAVEVEEVVETDSELTASAEDILAKEEVDLEEARIASEKAEKAEAEAKEAEDKAEAAKVAKAEKAEKAKIKKAEKAAADKKSDSAFNTLLEERALMMRSGGAINHRDALEANIGEMLLLAHDGGVDNLDKFITYLQTKSYENTGFGAYFAKNNTAIILQNSVTALYVICLRIAGRRRNPSGKAIQINAEQLKSIINQDVVTFIKNNL